MAPNQRFRMKRPEKKLSKKQRRLSNKQNWNFLPTPWDNTDKSDRTKVLDPKRSLCKICGISLNPEDLNAHIDNCNKKAMFNLASGLCSFCCKFIPPHQMEHHLTSHEFELCPICSTSFPLNYMNLHLNRHYKLQRRKIKRGFELCRVCVTSVSSKTMKKHNTVMKCSVCTEAVPFCQLTRHKKTHGFEICPVCLESVPLHGCNNEKHVEICSKYLFGNFPISIGNSNFQFEVGKEGLSE